MADSKSLDPPNHVDEAQSANPETRREDTSDSDDQFSDARSGPATPNLRSPTPKASKKQKEAPLKDEVTQDEEEAPAEDPTPKQINANVQDKTGDVEETAPSNVGEAEDNEGGDNFGDDFGDDFDDFEEGGGAEDGFDDFDDDDFAQPEPAVQTPATPQHKPPPFAIPDFDGLSPDDVLEATEDLLNTLYPPEMLEVPAPQTLPKDASVFINPRSASLWSQLVAPPPLAPPDWIRSRTRRLFLVSLGVPVDLDEILPASKQKKLILPSLNLTSSARTSSEARGNGVARLKQGDDNASSTSVDSQGKLSASKTRRGPPAQPDLDLVAARYLCSTTDEALGGMTDEELKAHIGKLEAMQGTAKDVLEYWKKRTDEKLGDREAFEGVIENLVKHARKVRK